MKRTDQSKGKAGNTPPGTSPDYAPVVHRVVVSHSIKSSGGRSCATISGHQFRNASRGALVWPTEFAVSRCRNLHLDAEQPGSYAPTRNVDAVSTEKPSPS